MLGQIGFSVDEVDEVAATQFCCLLEKEVCLYSAAVFTNSIFTNKTISMSSITSSPMF